MKLERIYRQGEGAIRRLGLHRLTRGLVLLSLPPTWLEIVVLHYRGSFQNRWMWAPLTLLPVVFAGGISSFLTASEDRSRQIFKPFANLLALVGGLGTFFHLRGVGRQMGGFRNWKYNVTTGPPFPAPMQVGLMGLLGLTASQPATSGEEGRLVRTMDGLNALSYVLFGVEAGYNHWTGSFFNRLMWIPVLLSPFMAFRHASLWLGPRGGRTVDGLISALAAGLGLVGFGFHVRNILRRPGGLRSRPSKQLNWFNLFYGAPTMAPLQLSALGLLGLLAALYRGKR